MKTEIFHPGWLRIKNPTVQPYFFSYADPSEKFHFSNRYNFCSDELFRLKSTKISILSGVLLLLARNYSLQCLVSILDFKIFHLGRHRKKNTAVCLFQICGIRKIYPLVCKKLVFLHIPYAALFREIAHIMFIRWKSTKNT